MDKPSNPAASRRRARWSAKLYQAYMAVAFMALLTVSLGMDVL